MQQSGAYAPDYVPADAQVHRRRMHTQCNKVHRVMLGPLRVSGTMCVLVDAFSRVAITADMAAQIRSRFRVYAEHNPVDEEDVARTCMRMFIGRPGVHERAIFGPEIIAYAASISRRDADDTAFVVVDSPARVRRFILRVASIIFRQEMRS
jgi:RNase P/RNase MRP subunit POP5